MKKSFKFSKSTLFISSIILFTFLLHLPSFTQESNISFESSAALKRTTVRLFSSTSVSNKQLDSLLKAAFSSPTGGNQRAWEFIIVTEREKILAMKEGNPYSSALDTAPLVIVIVVDNNIARYKELLEFDTGIATQSILIQAAELGLSTIPMSIAPQKERIISVSKALELPENIIPHIMIGIGYPATDGDSSASVIYNNNNKIHYNKY